MPKLYILAACIALAGCAGTSALLSQDNELKAQATLGNVCKGYGITLTDGAAYKARLSVKTVARVDQIRGYLNPQCGLNPDGTKDPTKADPPTFAEVASTAVTSALGELTALLATAK